MSDSDSRSLTALLEAWRGGEGAAYGALFEQAYAQLKLIANQRIGSAPCATLSPTELVHEAAMKVIGNQLSWKDRNHFFASMSMIMRSVLIDRARARLSQKRAGHAVHVTLGQVEVGDDSPILDLLALDDALNRLQALDERSSSVLHLTYFGGLSRQQISDVLQVSVQIVDRELRFAKSWLNSHIESSL